MRLGAEINSWLHLCRTTGDVPGVIPKLAHLVSDVKDYSWSMAYPAITTGITCASHALWQQTRPWDVYRLEEEAAEYSLKGGDIYVSPRRGDWPVYDPATRTYKDASDYKRQAGQEPDTRESLLDLSREDAWSLSIVRVFNDLKQDPFVVVTRFVL